MKRYSIGNLILFAVLSVAILGGWWLVDTYLIPKPPPPETPPTEPKKAAADLPASPKLIADSESLLAVTGAGVAGKPAELIKWTAQVKPAEPPKPVEPSVPHRLIALSGEKYNLKVLLTNKGAGVQQVALPAFDQASVEGATAKDTDDESGKPYPLELVPGYYRQVDRTTVKKDGPHVTLAAGEAPKGVRLAPPSYALLHYDATPDGTTVSPSAELATRKWAVVSERAGTEEKEGEVVFETTLDSHHVRIRKTFALSKLDFHVRMKLEFFPAEGQDPPKELAYQISGPRNVPIEGEWYSGVHRNAIVGCKASNGSAYRAIADAAHITTEHGSLKYTSNSSEVPGDFTFTAVVNQFFAAALCIDPDQPDEVRKGLWAYVRATREWNETDRPFDPKDDREVFFADKPQLGDITVRAVSKPVRPSAAGTEHRYWLYHGPSKVRLLKSLHLLDKDHQGFAADVETVDNKYLGDLSLNVITDAPAPNFFGGITGSIGWTSLVVWFTNRMHDVLGWMHSNTVPVWGLNIIMLTVMVRLLLMLPSRRQQAGMLKMQEKMAAMKPELAKLQEQFKSDPQRLNQEKTKLMLKHGVNPLTSMGGCVLMFAQMPVFLGLYYCLQESIFFRLDNFLWIKNLAAPDMLLTADWAEKIPYVSSADQIGHSWYLGPFVNILPVVAVALMYLNFKVSSPPPTDEQQEMSQKTMKFMMIFMGVFFYKMAAGLCVYFICSTLWGLTERWLLKRKKKKLEADIAAGLIPPGPTLNTTAPAKPPAPSGPPKPPGFFEKVKQGLLEKLEEAQKQAEAKGQTIVNNPQQKPPQGGPPTPGVNGTGKKKKKRKK